MHDIEPYYHWRQHYQSENDERSPFYGSEHSEFMFSNTVYNYYVHPQWDSFGSNTLYAKQIWTDYEEAYTIIELIGEWNDTLYNDVKFFKEEVLDIISLQGVNKFIIIFENVLNFHGDDNCYYEEFSEEIREEGGWITFINTLKHVKEELEFTSIDPYVFFGTAFNDIEWRPKTPKIIFERIEKLIIDIPSRIF